MVERGLHTIYLKTVENIYSEHLVINLNTKQIVNRNSLKIIPIIKVVKT